MNRYIRKVQYYETDRMGFTHHSNHIRWMEEARIDYLAQLGWDYDRLEKEGIISPVIEIECRYKKSTTFSDEIAIAVSVAELGGTKFRLAYQMEDSSGNVVCEASSLHVFIGADGRIMKMKKNLPGLYETLKKEHEKTLPQK